LDGKVVSIDAAGLLWQCAAKHAMDFLSGTYYLCSKSTQLSRLDTISILMERPTPNGEGTQQMTTSNKEHI